jgi:hypothetical protein
MDTSGATLNFVLDIDNGFVLGTEAVLLRRPCGLSGNDDIVYFCIVY